MEKNIFSFSGASQMSNIFQIVIKPVIGLLGLSYALCVLLFMLAYYHDGFSNREAFNPVVWLQYVLENRQRIIILVALILISKPVKEYLYKITKDLLTYLKYQSVWYQTTGGKSKKSGDFAYGVGSLSVNLINLLTAIVGAVVYYHLFMQNVHNFMTVDAIGCIVLSGVFINGEIPNKFQFKIRHHLQTLKMIKVKE